MNCCGAVRCLMESLSASASAPLFINKERTVGRFSILDSPPATDDTVLPTIIRCYEHVHHSLDGDSFTCYVELMHLGGSFLRSRWAILSYNGCIPVSSETQLLNLCTKTPNDLSSFCGPTHPLTNDPSF